MHRICSNKGRGALIKTNFEGGGIYLNKRMVINFWLFGKCAALLRENKFAASVLQ